MRPVLVLTMVTGIMVAGAPAPAQTPGQQMPAQQTAPTTLSPELVTACVDAQQQVEALANQVNMRLEEARQTNNPQRMRAALADLQAALVEIRTRAAECSPLRAAAQSTDAHVGMPGMSAKPAAPRMPMTQPGGTKPAPATSDPHTAHTVPSAAKAPSTKPSTVKPSPKPSDPHAGHDAGKLAASKPGPPPGDKPTGKQVFAPDCPKPIDPATAPSTTYQGTTYYFCSAADRLRFIRNPEAYLKKTKGVERL